MKNLLCHHDTSRAEGEQPWFRFLTNSKLDKISSTDYIDMIP